MTQSRISIAMATFNGANYIQDQLDSLSIQTLLPHELVICDDGSNDNTLEIVELFAKDAPFPVRIFSNESNLGYADNFLKAASLCKGEWIAFCDQDDVWLPHKLSVVSSRFQEDVLLVVHSADLVDSELNSLSKRWPDLENDEVVTSLQNKPWWTPAGFTQCVAAELLQNYSWKNRPHDFNFPNKMQAHDEWSYFLANTFGNISYIKESLALYRRHDSAVTGDYRSTLFDRIKGVKSADSKHYNMLAEIANEYAITLSAILNNEKKLDDKKELAIDYYRRLNQNLLLRSQLHAGAGVRVKFTVFVKLFRDGAYRSIKKYGFGFKAFIKDLGALVW